MKKTLLLTHEYYPFKGGVARYCYNLFKNFEFDKYLVVTDHPEVKISDNIIKLKLTCRFLKPTWLLAYFKIKFLIRKHQIAQIFTPNILPLGSLAYFLKIPYVISLHGLDINLALKNKPKLTYKILHQAKAIIVNTKNTAQILKPLNLEDNKIHLVYPSLDFDINYDEIKLKAFRKKLNIKDTEKVLLTVGRLTKRKGQDLVIKALKDLKNDFNLRYFIVGRGKMKSELQELIKKYHLDNRVFIFDNVDDEDLVYYYKLADIFVMPHRQDELDIEGFGMVFLEAAQFQLAVIAGNSGGAGELLENKKNALLIKHEDISGLCKALKCLLNNPQEADKLGKALFKRANAFKNSYDQSLILKKIL